MSQQSSILHSGVSSRLQTVLQQIVDDVVERLGCLGAIATTLEQGNALFVRAYAFALGPTHLQALLDRIGFRLDGTKAVVYLDNKKHKRNLSVSAIKGERDCPHPFLASNRLYDLLRPLVDKKSAEKIQQELEIKQVIVIPFAIEDEVYGNLLAATCDEFSERDIDFLIAFGRQAAASIQSHKHLAAMQVLERVIFKLQSRMTDETQVLQMIADAMVEDLGYAGAMVATLEEGGILPVRAYAVDVAPDLLRQLEERVGITLIGPQAMVNLNDERYKENLSVRAVQGLNGRPEKYLVSDKLHDLLRPVAPKSFASVAQRLLGIEQVIAVPFFLQDEVVGNLFVATRRPTFSAWEISILTAFGQQAAVDLRNARLYRETENQRQIAEKFGRMAFSATASVHALRNHVSATRTYLHLLRILPEFSEEEQQEMLQKSPSILERLDKAADILDNLHSPWQETADKLIDLNSCLNRALREVFPDMPLYQDEESVPTGTGVMVHLSLMPDLPKVKTSPDMLAEAFRVLIKNAAEAMQGCDGECHLWITSRTAMAGQVHVTVRDSGVGIEPENITRIFDLGWSTKQGKGMGFGLFWTKDYITGLGGSIQVESTLQKGTAFHVYLTAVSDS